MAKKAKKPQNKLPPVRRFKMGESLHNETFLFGLGYQITKKMRFIKIEYKNKIFKIKHSEFLKFVDKIRVSHGYEPIIKPRS